MMPKTTNKYKENPFALVAAKIMAVARIPNKHSPAYAIAMFELEGALEKYLDWRIRMGLEKDTSWLS